MKRLLAFSFAVAPLLFLAGCGSNNDVTGPTQLMVQDVVVGTGATAANGDTLNVTYVAMFTDGSVLESGPYTFVLGAGQVIPGWDQGLVGMKVGGKRRLTVPPSLAYGSQGNGAVPPNTTLVFDITLVSINGK